MQLTGETVNEEKGDILNMVEKFVEKRERTPFGKAMLWLFWGSQAVMGLGIVQYLIRMSSFTIDPSSDASAMGYAMGQAVGMGVGFFLVLFIWLVGTVILGVLALITRGEKIISKL